MPDQAALDNSKTAATKVLFACFVTANIYYNVFGKLLGDPPLLLQFFNKNCY